MNIFLLGVLVFISEVIADYAWARYMTNVAEKQPHRAALWSCMIQIIACFAIASLIESYWMALPAIAGSYVGTVWAVKRERADD